MEKKAIIVVWKWDLRWISPYARYTDGKFCDFLKDNISFKLRVEKSNEKRIFIGFTKSNSHTNKTYYKDYIKEAKDKCSELLKKHYKILLLLHAGGIDKLDKGSTIYKELKDKENIKIFFFKAGKGVIYKYIIDEMQTYFREDAINNPLDCSKINLKKTHFDFVWDFYWKECKKKLYELKEDLLLCLYPLTFQEKKDFSECINNDMLVGVRIKNFIGDEDLTKTELKEIKDLEKKRENYYLFTDCYDYYQKRGEELYAELKNTLKFVINNDVKGLLDLLKKDYKSIFPNSKISSISELIRNQFKKLLNTMSEDIY